MKVRLVEVELLAVAFASYEAQGRADAFFHHVTEFARKYQLALAVEGSSLYCQSFASDGSPSQARGYADAVFLREGIGVSGYAQKLMQILWGNFYRLFIFQILLCGFAAYRADFTLKIAYAAFADILAHNKIKRGHFYFKAAFRQAVFFHLPGQEVPLRYFPFFVVGIAGEFYNFQAVS